MVNLTVEVVHTFAVGDGAWVVHNENRPEMPKWGDAFDIALGVGERVETFAQSFTNPFAYHFWYWPDELIRSEGIPLTKRGLLPEHKSKIMQLGMSSPADTIRDLKIVLNRVAAGEVPETTIRFNLQGLTPTREITLAELRHIQANPALQNITRYYDGPGNELSQEDAQRRVKSLCQ